MALRFVDSFDHYATASGGAKYTGFSGVIGGSGRNGSCLELQATAGYTSLTLDSQATWIVGFAFNWGSSAATSPFLKWYDTATVHLALQMTAAGKIEIRRNTTLLGTGSSTLSVGAWYYIEFKCNISDTTGTPVLKVNGVTETITWVTGTGTTQDTRNGANASANIIQLTGPGGTSASLFDDYYICDATGSSPTNDFLGDCRVECLHPNGNGNSSVLVGSDGNSTDNYQLVDETTPSTADYVESSTPGDKDTYTFGNLTATSGTVYGVQVLPYAAKTDAGSRSIVSVARLSGTEVDSAVKTLGSSYLYLWDVRETKPGGGSWSISDVNSAEFGVKVNA